jgi:hypothetical protein
MLDNLKELFKEGLGYTHTAGILQQLANIVNIVNVQYMKDENGKNSAIDIICTILQSHKDINASKIIGTILPTTDEVLHESQQ